MQVRAPAAARAALSSLCSTAGQLAAVSPGLDLCPLSRSVCSLSAGAIAQLTEALRGQLGTDAKLRRQVCCALGQIAKASPALAAEVAQSTTLREIVR